MSGIERLKEHLVETGGMGRPESVRVERCDQLSLDFGVTRPTGSKENRRIVETLYFGASAANPGCDPDGDGNMGPGHPANQCFVPGGAILEYRMDAAHLDGANGLPCTGDANDGYGPGEGNEGCAMPIAVFEFVAQGDGTDDDTSGLPDGVVETIDPRMVMTIHEAFVQ